MARLDLELLGLGVLEGATTAEQRSWTVARGVDRRGRLVRKLRAGLVKS